MWVKRLLWSISLLGLISGAKSQLKGPQPLPENENVDVSDTSKSAKIDYMMSVSAMLPSGKTGLMCIYINCKESIQLNVTFEHQSTGISIFNDLISSTFFECRNLQIPTVDTTQLAYVTFTAIGETVDIRKRKDVVIDNLPEACFAQMEKKLYKPGDVVRCMLFCLNSDLKPTKQNFTRVFLVDQNGARIAQLVDPPSDHNVVSVEFPLSKEAAPGQYSLRFEGESGDPVTSYFTVERYTLQRFYSTVACPNQVSVLEKSAEIQVSAQYTYKKPLAGTVIGKCCRNVRYTSGRARNCMRGLENICMNFTAEMESGAYIHNLDMDTFKLPFSEYDSSIQCEVTVKEAWTGVLDTTSCYIYITSQPVNLQRDYTYNNQFYKHGLSYPVVLTLTNEKGQPMANEMIFIAVDGITVKNVTTDAQGRAECGIDTTPYYKPNITISASYTNEDQCYATNQQSQWFRQNNCISPDFPYLEWMVYRFFSESNSYLQIKKIPEKLSCRKTYSIEVEYIVTEAAVGKGVTTTTFYYMVKAKETIVFHGQQSVDLTDSWKGSFMIDLYVTHEYATYAQLLCFGIMQMEIISDTLELTVESCFNNVVSLSFMEAVVEPGSEVKWELSAAPGSICGIRASDASLDLLGFHDSFNPDDIYNSLRNYQYGYQVGNFNLEDPAPPCEDPNTEVFCNGRYYRQVSSPTDGDTYGNLLPLSLIVTSNLRTRKPQVCGMEDVYFPYYGCNPVHDRIAFAKSLSGGGGSIETVRQNFQDIFGWQFKLIGPTGNETATALIPDTITEWNSDMFCLSEKEGVGLSNQTKVTTMLKFFVEVTMPSHCTRGEKIIMVTSAANFLDNCAKVEFGIEASDGSKPNLLSDDGQNCICKGQRVSKQYSIDVISLGDVKFIVSASTISISNSCDGANDDSEPLRKDTVIKNITVEAEGLRREVTSSHLNIVKNSTIENEITVQMPDNLVEGSYELHLTVVGEPIGLVANNLRTLLKFPGGICRHNVALLRSIVSLITYLENTGDLDDDLFEKAKSFLQVGYGQLLACRRSDGHYSEFYDSDVPNSWLDIKAYYTCEKIKRYVFIDEIVQQQTLLQLGKLQNLTTGCFSPIGSSFTTQDDKNREIQFTSLMVITLMESKSYSTVKTLLDGGLRCLQAADLGSMKIYTLAYLLHAAAVTNLPSWETLYSILRERAIIKDFTAHWERENLPTGKPYYFLPIVYASAEVDMTATIMLGIMKGPTITEEMEGLIGMAATWMTISQNAQGYYSSPQDTAVATEAMTEYGRRFHVKDPNVEVVVSLGDKEVARINVTEENKMLVQRRSLPVEFGSYKMSTSGIGSPLVQLKGTFHTKIPRQQEDSPFSLNVTTRAETCTEGVAYVIFTSICASYKESRNQADMVLIDIKTLTGYTIDEGKAKQLVSLGIVSDVKFDDNHVLFYLEYMTRDVTVCFSLTSYLDQRASLLQSSPVTIQDLSNPAESAYAAHTYPCSPIPVE